MNVQSKARELIEAGRYEVVLDDRRLEDNRARVLARAAALGAAAVGVSLTSSVGATSKAVGAFSLAKLAVAVAVVGGSVTGGYALVKQIEKEPVAAAAVVAPRQPTAPPRVAPPRPEVAAEVGEPLSDDAPQIVAKGPAILPGSANKSAPSANSLSAHAELLRDARTALAGGDAARSLALLDGHREVGRGPLGPEWAAARILVLCRLGRVAEARQMGARFLKAHPRSPLAAQVAGSCAAE